MKPNKEYTFEITPMSQVKTPRKGSPDTQQFIALGKYRKRIASIAKAKGFKPSGALKIIFIIPIPKKHTPLERFRMIGEPHNTKGYALHKLVKPVREALYGEDTSQSRIDLHRIDASKYWGDAGKIIIKHITVEDFDFLKQRIG